MDIDVSLLNPKEYIIIKGAQVHNLKNLDVAIPRDKLVVITGLSGSGKSSLAFDTLYAEGQRRYVESLSSYARQFMGKLDKPKVDFIKGIAPAIAIQQKVNTTNSRSTVGTLTEIYDYLKLLFFRVGKTLSPISGEQVKKHTATDVVDSILNHAEGTKILLLVPISIGNKKPEDILRTLSAQGFARVFYNDKVLRIDKAEAISSDFYLVVDRVIVKENDEDFKNRLYDAIQVAFHEGKGECIIYDMDTKEQQTFNNRFELDDIEFIEPNLHFFSFNNPYGACPLCEGHGSVMGVDESLVIPNTSISVYDNAIAPWRGEVMSKYKKQLLDNAYKFDFPIHRPWFELTEKEKSIIWKGNTSFLGLNGFFEMLEKETYKIQNRILLSRYRGKTTCKICKGKRLRPETNNVKINGKTISDLVDISVTDLTYFFNNIVLTEYEQKVAKRLLKEINNRLDFLIRVGLGYLTLNRKSNTLSGGESQRINLATSLGSSLVGSMYILDEPSIGLHPKDTEKLISVLKMLRDLGNSVIVVEHDEDIIRTADYILDIGPFAGTNGGQLVGFGKLKDILKTNTLTTNFLSGKEKIAIPKRRSLTNDYIKIIGARAYNLKNIDVTFPLNCFTIITGVSGSGKSTLVNKILFPALENNFEIYNNKPVDFTKIEVNSRHLFGVEYINQNPIGRSSRSNSATYIKAYDDIRTLFASQKLAISRCYKPGDFSFNSGNGRCDECQGEGTITIEMQFMADIHIPCEVCRGKRFKKEVLEITFGEKTISDILNLTIDDAVSFFREHTQNKIANKLGVLQQVGMGYVTLGQSSSTLSGGEAQRIKLASFLSKGQTNQNKLFIFDEPTTGLHFADIEKLIHSFNLLIERGHSIIVIEHNLEMIKCADFIIDMGPEGGEGGGNVIATGTPEEIITHKKSVIGKYLKEKLED